jgi:nitrogen fixation protein FixH
MNAPNPGRNLWPLGIVSAFGVFIAGTAGLIGLSLSQRSDLVSADYYEQEIRHQQQMERLDRTQRLGAETALRYDAALRHLEVRVPVAHVRAGLRGGIHLYRPSAAGLDRRLKLEPDADGLQTVDLSETPVGLWKVRVSWTAAGQEFFLDQKLVVGAESPAKAGG